MSLARDVPKDVGRNQGRFADGKSYTIRNFEGIQPASGGKTIILASEEAGGSANQDHTLNQNVGRNPLGLRLIGAFKVASGLLLVGLGVGLFRNAGGDPALEAEHVVSALKLDPGNRYIHAGIEKISGITPGQLRVIGVGTFLYALMYLVEGGGLLLRKHWAEYFTVAATGLFIPLEVYEVARRPTTVRLVVLIINLAIVAYLIVQLRRKRPDDSRGFT